MRRRMVMKVNGRSGVVNQYKVETGFIKLAKHHGHCIPDGLRILID